MPGQLRVKIVVGSDSLCRGKTKEEKCLSLTAAGECSKDIELGTSGRVRVYDEKAANFFGLQIGNKPTVSEIRDKLNKKSKT